MNKMQLTNGLWFLLGIRTSSLIFVSKINETFDKMLMKSLYIVNNLIKRRRSIGIFQTSWYLNYTYINSIKRILSIQGLLLTLYKLNTILLPLNPKVNDQVFILILLFLFLKKGSPNKINGLRISIGISST